MIIVMRNADSPYLIDLFAIFLRWLALFGLAVALGVGSAFTTSDGRINLVTLVVILLPMIWNGFVSVISIFNRRLPYHRPISVGLDILFALLLFIFTGGPYSAVWWASLLPLFSSAMYFEVRGAVIAAIIITILQAGHTYFVVGHAFQWMTAGLLGLNVIAGLGIGLFSAPLLRKLRQTYQGQISQHKENERIAQRKERDRMRTLFDMIETFSSTLNYQTVLETMLDNALSAMQVPETSDSPMIAAVLLFDDNQDLEMCAARGFVSRDFHVRLRAEEGALPESMEIGEAHLIENPALDPELGKLLSIQEHNIALCIPLIRGMNAYGIILFAHTDGEFFDQDRAEILQMLSNQAVIALQNAKLYQELSKEKERIVQTQEEAQKKLARDLHDGPTQSVAAIAMRVNITRKMLETGQSADVPEELERIEDLARRTTQEIRHMLFTLRPLVLESEGLYAALNTMADKMQDLYQQHIVIDADPTIIQMLDPSRQTVIFHLVEESVNNARKHAQASEIQVRLKFVPDDTCIGVLDIIDNGIGFNVDEVLKSYDRRGSLGMVNLRERTDLINGLLKIDSLPGKGTRIRVLIPLTEEASDRIHHLRKQLPARE
jgi:signal transduction histidine kinase